MALPTLADSTGMDFVWQHLDSLFEAANNAQEPTHENGWGVLIQTLIWVIGAGIVLGTIAVTVLCRTIVVIFRKWESGQAAGIKALSTSKDNTKKELTDILKSELGNSRAANAADNAEVKSILVGYGRAINTLILDIVVIGNKLKIPVRSSPTTEFKDPPQEGGK